MNFFPANTGPFIGGAHGFVITYDDVRVSYVSPNDYQVGAPLVGFQGKEPPFRNRIDEIFCWGAICTAAGEALLRIFDTLSFAPGLDQALRSFRKDAVGLVAWRLRQEGCDMPAPDVQAALERELTHIAVHLMSVDAGKPKPFVLKRYEEAA